MNNEQRYYDSLKRITKYQSIGRMKKKSNSDWDLSYLKTLEYAYENVIAEAKDAIHGKRRPKDCQCKNNENKLSKAEELEAAKDLARDAMGEIGG